MIQKIVLAVLAVAASVKASPAAMPQSQNIYAPFSGILNVQVVGPGGTDYQYPPPSQELEGAQMAICPESAPQGCGNISVWNWCCPAGKQCQWNSDKSAVGCCPVGSTCGGSPPNPHTTTVTVTEVPAPTQTEVQTTVYQSPPMFTSTQVVAGPVTYCSTITMRNLETPTSAPGACGIVLFVGSAPSRMGAVLIPSLLAALFSGIVLLRWV